MLKPFNTTYKFNFKQKCHKITTEPTMQPRFHSAICKLLSDINYNIYKGNCPIRPVFSYLNPPHKLAKKRLINSVSSVHSFASLFLTDQLSSFDNSKQSFVLIP